MQKAVAEALASRLGHTCRSGRVIEHVNKNSSSISNSDVPSHPIIIFNYVMVKERCCLLAYGSKPHLSLYEKWLEFAGILGVSHARGVGC